MESSAKTALSKEIYKKEEKKYQFEKINLKKIKKNPGDKINLNLVSKKKNF